MRMYSKALTYDHMIVAIKIEQREKERDRWMTGKMTVRVCVRVFKRKVIFMRSEGIGRELREGV